MKENIPSLVPQNNILSIRNVEFHNTPLLKGYIIRNPWQTIMSIEVQEIAGGTGVTFSDQTYRSLI